MRNKMFALVGSAVLAIGFPILTQAGITVHNKTNSYATTIVKNSPCSSTHPSGISKPGQSIPASQEGFLAFCGISKNCTAHIFMSKDCSPHSKIATFKVNVGLVNSKIVTADLDQTRYKIDYNSESVTITEKSSLQNWLHSILG